MGTNQGWITRKNKMKDLQESIKGYVKLCESYEKKIAHLEFLLGHYEYSNAPLFNDNEVALVFKKRPTTMEDMEFLKEWFKLAISAYEADIKAEELALNTKKEDEKNRLGIV